MDQKYVINKTGRVFTGTIRTPKEFELEFSFSQRSLHYCFIGLIQTHSVKKMPKRPVLAILEGEKLKICPNYGGASLVTISYLNVPPISKS